MKIIIDLELSPKQKKLIRTAVVAGAVIGALGIGIAVAGPKQFSSGTVVSASDMNINFNDLDSRLSAVEVRGHTSYDGGTYSVGATRFVKATAASTGLVGSPSYVGAKNLCQNTVGSPTAHVCTSEEIVRSQSMGMAVPDGWYITGVWSLIAPNTYVNDCEGLNSANSNERGMFLSGGWPSSATCNGMEPVLCCD